MNKRELDKLYASIPEGDLIIIDLKSKGYAAKEISEITGQATKTIENHLDNWRRKLNATSTTEIVRQCCDRGLLTDLNKKIKTKSLL